LAFCEQNLVAKLDDWIMKEHDTTIDTNLVYHSSRDLHLSHRKVNQSFPGAVTLRFRENVTDNVTVLLLEA